MRERLQALTWRRTPALALAGAGAVLLAGCSDGEPIPSTSPETVVAADHLGSGFHWDLITSSPQPVNGATWEFPVAANVGTGNINSFLRVQADPEEDGFNTDGTRNYDQKGGQFTHSILLSDLPTVIHGGVPTKEIIFDANESNSDLTAAQFAINEFDLWQCDTGTAAPATYDDRAQLAANCDLVYEINDGTMSTGRAQATDAATQGSGQALDYRIFIPEALFNGNLGECEYAPQGSPTCDTYIILDVDIGDDTDSDWESGATFEEFSLIRRPAVEVSKTAVGTFTRTYHWMVEKTADEESHMLLPGETGTTEYTITADLDSETPYTDSEFEVSGVITIENVWEEPALILDIWDELPDGSNLLFADLTCAEGGSPVTELPYELGAGDTMTCEYGAGFEGGTTNTAHVSIADPVDEATELPDETATADVQFGDPTEVDATVDVYDEYLGSDDPDAAPVFLGTASVDDPPPTAFNRTRMWTFDDPSACGVFDNTGSIYPAGADAIPANLLDSNDAQVTVTCGNLTVTKDAETTRTRTFNWTIEKTVSPDTWDLFTGDSGTSEYTVSVDKVDFIDSDWAVSGTITIVNDGGFPISVSGVDDVIDGSISATVDCGVSFPHEIAVDGELMCSYSSDLPDGDAGTNVATANVVGGGSFSSDPVPFDHTNEPSVLVDDEINVTDTNGMSWGPVSDDASWQYERTFACDADEGPHENTATIDETGQSDDATVTVNCYGLTVTKTAETEWTRTWTWSIDKSIDPSQFIEGTYDGATNTATIMDGNILDVDYTIELDATSVASDFDVDGTITVTNPAPMDAELTGVADVISPDIAASVSCPALTVSAGGQLECTYGPTSVPDASSRTNTATATLQNYDYASDGSATAAGTTDYDGMADVIFAADPTYEIDECVTVADILGGDLASEVDVVPGTYCASEGLPETFIVTRTFGGPEGFALACGENTYNNVATFTTNDTAAQDSDDADINIVVECIEGCTLTQGYWKTHNLSFHGGASKKADETWDELDAPYWDGSDWVDGDGVMNAENELFFLSGQTWFEVFWTAPKGNAYYNLAHQWMAAYLNTLAGASAPSEVQAALDAGQALFETYTPEEIADLKGKNGKELRQQFIDAAGTLADFNEGLIGPGHCTEEDEG